MITGQDLATWAGPWLHGFLRSGNPLSPPEMAGENCQAFLLACSLPFRVGMAGAGQPGVAELLPVTSLWGVGAPHETNDWTSVLFPGRKCEGRHPPPLVYKMYNLGFLRCCLRCSGVVDVWSSEARTPRERAAAKVMSPPADALTWWLLCPDWGWW